MLRAEADGDASRRVVDVGELALGLDPGAGIRVEAVEADVFALEGVVDAGLAEVVEDRLLELCDWASVASATCVAVGGGRS